MKAFISSIIFAALLETITGLEEDHTGTTINELLSPGFNCLEQRKDVICPPANGTESNASSSHPLVLFYLFTPRNKKNPEFLHDCGGALPANTYFDPNINTEVFIHGFFDGVCKAAHWREMKDQLFVRGMYNIILVDWSAASFPDLYDALHATKYVGKRIAFLIGNIMQQSGASKSKFHLIGHSLGAHIAGIAGYVVPGLRRITGLDTALIPGYEYPPDERLTDDDALMVDTIFTNFGNCLPFSASFKDPLGHANFYPNGGKIQESCFPYILASYLKGDVFYATVSLAPPVCYHVQSLQYYKVSINPCRCQFVAVKCPNYESFRNGSCKSCSPDGSNCAVMGMDWEYYYTGSTGSEKNERYYLDTTLLCPYCDVTLNKLLGPNLFCFKQRIGAVCPNNGSVTEDCVKTSDPLTLFYLFTPKNKKNPEFLHECGGRLPSNTYFDPTIKTEVFIHGTYDGTCRTAVWREMRDQLFVRGDYNVLFVDWSRENFPDSYVAGLAHRDVARRTACVIQNMIKQTGVSKDKFHLIGHSAGSRIAGLVGQAVRGLKRITGLDPENPAYYEYPPDEMLSSDDASMVDVIHTSRRNCFLTKYDYNRTFGHANFYPNGGVTQPSCFPYILISFLKLDIPYAVISFSTRFCYHLQALQFYKASINPCRCQFVGVKCTDYQSFQSGNCKTCRADGSNCAVMGMDWEYYYTPSDGNTSQKYFLDTTLFCPYCDNQGIVLNGFPKTSEKQDPGLHCFETAA